MRGWAGTVALLSCACLYQNNPDFGTGSSGGEDPTSGSASFMSTGTVSSASASTTTSTSTSSPGTTGDPPLTEAGSADSSSTGGVLDPDLLLYTTLDDPEAIASPKVGDGTDAASIVDGFTDGVVADAANFSSVDAHIAYRVAVGGTQNLDPVRGTIDFWYRPAVPVNDGEQRWFVDTEGLSIRVAKSGGGPLRLAIEDNAGQVFGTRVDQTLAQWVVDEWVRYTMTWDTTVVDAPMVHIYINGTEAGAYISQPLGPLVMGDVSATDRLFIGGGADAGGAGSATIEGDLDEFKIFGVVRPPR